MKKIFQFQSILLAIAAISLLLSATGNSPNYLSQKLPGVIRIGANIYYDQTEVNNVEWRQYMYWTIRIFGKNSDEYNATLPDTTVWTKKDACLISYKSEYLRHMQYDFYPLVGITQKQAEGYAKWRSDRVFEKILIENHIIKQDQNQNRQNHFTIEKYFAGQYQGVKPDKNFMYYPNYRLPTINEWKIALHFEDSIEHKHKAKPLPLNTDVEPCSKKQGDCVTKVTRVTSQDMFDDISERNHPIQYLKGNVSEWTSEKNVCIGGGWADKAQILATQDTFHLETVNAWTGFRNVCEWKEYK